MITDETYWLVENHNNEIIGCGGWSKRSLFFGNEKTMAVESESNLINNKTDPAKMRAFFFHPNYTRQGIGKELLKICENEAQSNGLNHWN